MLRQGFLRLEGAVSQELVREARRQINASLGHDGLRNDSPDRTSSGNTRVRGAFDDLGRTPVILDLMRGSDVQPLLESALGAPIEPVANGQIRLCFPADLAEDGATVDIDMGVRNDHIPFNGWNGHVDGFWNKVYGQNGGGKQKKTWPDQEPPAPGEGLRDFNALVAIPLSRQLDTDVGNLALLRGGHEMMAAGFRAQREAGGPLGPDGPGWDRFNANVK